MAADVHQEVLDVEMVHALAPDATLVILLVPPTSLDNTKNAVSAAVGSLRLGSTEGGVISVSAAAQIGGEHCVSRAQASSVNAGCQPGRSRPLVADERMSPTILFGAMRHSVTGRRRGCPAR